MMMPREVISRKCKGAWLHVNNDYLKLPTTEPPLKLSACEKERRWSHWLESLQKDVDCTFRILKGWWRILKMGMDFKGSK